jgi:hypothetical protein
MAFCICVANHQSLSKGPHELRCASVELPLDRPRHQPVGQEELEYSRTKWQDQNPGHAADAPTVADGFFFFVLGIVSAPLWDSKTSTFAGLLTTSDYINVIQYYVQNPEKLNQIDQFRLDSLRGGSSYTLSKKGLPL